MKRKGCSAQSRGEQRRLRHVLLEFRVYISPFLRPLRVFRGGLVPFTCDDFGRRAEKGQPTGGHRLVSCHGNMYGRQLSDSDFLFGDLMLYDRQDRSAQIQGCFPNSDLQAQPMAMDTVLGYIGYDTEVFSSSGARA